MCSRASRRVAESRSFWETAWASWPLVSRSRSSSVRTRFGASWRRRRRTTTSSSRRLQLALELADLALVLGEAPLVLGRHAVTSFSRPLSDGLASRTLHRALRSPCASFVTRVTLTVAGWISYPALA